MSYNLEIYYNILYMFTAFIEDDMLLSETIHLNGDVVESGIYIYKST
jgi:hypothetical protein